MRYPDYLMHFGIKGMKWGVRRFQNKDGSYTPLGLKRHGNGTSGGSGKARAGSGSNAEARKARLKKAAKIAAIAGGTALAGYGAYRLAKSGKVPRIGMDKLKGIPQNFSGGIFSEKFLVFCGDILGIIRGLLVAHPFLNYVPVNSLMNKPPVSNLKHYFHALSTKNVPIKYQKVNRKEDKSHEK